MRKLAIFVLTGLILSILPSAPVQAIYNGNEVTGTPYVLTLLTSKEARTSFCSMALLTERIVVTAAHCVIKDQGKAPELRWDIKDIYVSQPGANVTTDDISTRVRVMQIVTEDDFVNTWKPEENDRRTQINDIAFLFLEKPLVRNYSIPIATEEEVNAAVQARALITHYGYGLQTQFSQSHSPWMAKLPLRLSSDAHLDPKKVIYGEEGSAALCPGDSGGPWYLNINGVMKIAAVTVAASGCRGNAPYNGGTLGTRIYPYMTMATKKWETFLKNESEILQAEKAKADALEKTRQNSITQGTYLNAGGCHAAGINAELQFKNAKGEWKASSSATGWIASDASCPATHPIQPWTVVTVADGAIVKWHYWSSSWSVFGDPFIWKNPVIAANAKPTIAPKTIIITCAKGTQKKRYKVISPQCPTGWKKVN